MQVSEAPQREVRQTRQVKQPMQDSEAPQREVRQTRQVRQVKQPSQSYQVPELGEEDWKTGKMKMKMKTSGKTTFSMKKKLIVKAKVLLMKKNRKEADATKSVRSVSMHSKLVCNLNYQRE